MTVGTSGRFGRTSPPPEGKVFVRDPAAANAKAVRDAVATFEAAGQEVPEHLAAVAGELGEPTDVVIEVDSGRQVESGRYTACPGEPEPVPEPVAAPPDPQPEFVAEPEPEPVPEPVAEPEPVPEAQPAADEDDLEDFTVAELKAELDALGVTYDPRARKADLIKLVEQSGG